MASVAARRTSHLALASRVARTVGVCLIVTASLATFPAAIPWMVAVWLAWHTLLAWRGRPGWLPLAACLGILLVKRVPWLPGLAVCLTAMMLVAMASAWRGWSPAPLVSWRRVVFAGLGIAWLSWGLLLWDWHASATIGTVRPLQSQLAIVCLGDSLTSGIAPDPGYPEHLGKITAVPVINMGQAGISTVEGLKLLPDLAAAKAQAVIIELGGHDFLKGHPPQATKENLRRIIQAARQAGAEPILMEVPRGFMIDPYAGLERELAREEDLELISDGVIRKLVLWSPYAPPGMWTGGPYLSDDGLHPNAAGNQELAQAAARALQRVFGEEILRAGR